MTVATIGKIVEIVPIPAADLVEQAVVVCGKEGKWRGVVKKGDFAVGDLCEVYLQDALLPTTDSRFDFMERKHHLVKIQTFRGARSECLIMPLTLSGYDIGTDIGEVVGVTKFEKPIPVEMQGQSLGLFPTNLVPKTDEPLFQKVPEMVEWCMTHESVITQKCDGSSVTYYFNNGHFGVCSRNYEIKQGPNLPWDFVYTYQIDRLLGNLPFNVALQAEAVGPNIQGNPMGLKGHELRAFSLYNIDEQRYLGDSALRDVCLYYVPVVQRLFFGEISMTEAELVAFAGSRTYQSSCKPQEGIVVRPLEEYSIGGQRVSFKVINPAYK